jgi:hypothetical protein
VRFNYGKYRLDAPQGQANCCLPTPSEAAARFDLGPFVAGIQNTRLTTHGMAFNYSKVLKPQLVNELRSRLRQHRAVHEAVDYGTTRRSRSAFTASKSARSRPGCRTSVSPTSPACQEGRRSCR